MRTFLIVWGLGALVGLLVNVWTVREEIGSWWLEKPPAHQKVIMAIAFPVISLVLWPILLILIVGIAPLRNRKDTE